MLGCDLKCACCQNWVTSQALRDPAAGTRVAETSPEQLVHEAVRAGARSVVSTYNEPLITTEWAVAVFKAARAAGLLTGYVSNGHATPRVLDYLAPWLDLCKIDLKGFDELQYRNYGGHLEPVLDTIRGLHARGIWVEVVTLIVPGLNNSDEELGQIAAFLAGVSPDIHGMSRPFTRLPDDGSRAHHARHAGARGRHRQACGPAFRVCGNAAGQVGDLEDTRCPDCRDTLVQRRAYWIGTCRVTADGRCPGCGSGIPGRWRQA